MEKCARLTGCFVVVVVLLLFLCVSLMVSVLYSGFEQSRLVQWPAGIICMVLLGRMLYSHSASLHPRQVYIKWVPVNLMLGITEPDLANRLKYPLNHTLLILILKFSHNCGLKCHKIYLVPVPLCPLLLLTSL